MIRLCDLILWEQLMEANDICDPLDLPVALAAPSFFKFFTSLTNRLTCSCNANTVFLKIWSSTLGPGVWAQSLVGTLNEYTQPALSPAVLWPCVTHTTERTRLKDKITFTILNPTSLTLVYPSTRCLHSLLTASRFPREWRWTPM